MENTVRTVGLDLAKSSFRVLRGRRGPMRGIEAAATQPGAGVLREAAELQGCNGDLHACRPARERTGGVAGSGIWGMTRDWFRRQAAANQAADDGRQPRTPRNARTAWSMIRHGTKYQEPSSFDSSPDET